ncbi:cell division protein FtsW [Pontibacillus halophilus JSM 076056 = DSM 19796]|uniref:Probable peptidoglycan glycosyltransferase FtsW n=1 Tax=Pontibacillus halophilus JSM 076056 = DSM 19796 TaxID=1385510 RepID=A0A0A5GMS7_9BACI|nr:putative lipid II flippase FtsW [Pontibacillus halophilus]KGX93304.1 cell division protein FtsW [Pontibacillus halophilus JSM 076056 = DSM 19796]
MKKFFKDYDFTLLFAPLLLTAFGVVMVYSASMVYAVIGEGLSSTHYFKKQLTWVSLGLVGFVTMMYFPYQKLQKLRKLILLFVIISLLAVQLFGTTVNNAKSWIDLGLFNFQPSETAKIGLVIFLSAIFARRQAYMEQFGQAVIGPLIVTSIVFSLIVFQPDIGTGAIVLAIAASVFISSGMQMKHVALMGIAGIVTIAFAAMNMVSVERVSRFTGAYQPFQFPESDGYHLIQSYVAIGTGGLGGEGLGQGVQKLGYLLEPHTDFIMAVIAEELGVIGVAIVIGLLALIVLRGFFIARKCKDAFGSLLAIGISFMIGIQAFINLGAVSGLLPVTGVPLPFVSYGGSSLLVLLASVGILNNIARQVRSEDYTSIKKTEDVDTTRERTSYTPHYQNRGGKPWVK